MAALCSIVFRSSYNCRRVSPLSSSSSSSYLSLTNQQQPSSCPLQFQNRNNYSVHVHCCRSSRPLSYLEHFNNNKGYGSVRRRPKVALFASTSVGQDRSVITTSHDNDVGNKNKVKTDDTRQSSWFDMYLPERAQPYAKLARLERPNGIWLLAWPCMWSIAMAAERGNLPDFKIMALLGLGSVFVRGAACTINDVLDKDFDAKVERTKMRPIASGALTPFQGLCFLCVQLLIGFGLLLPLNTYSCVLGAFHLPFILAYPLMKRLTYWSQAFLGLAFNWGALLGWSAVKGSLDPFIVLPLYMSGFCWTLVYDTIYAHQDKKDDVKAGVKSTALRFGDLTKEWLTGFGVACMMDLAYTGFNAGLGWPYYASLVAATGHLLWQVHTVDLSNPADCNRKFNSNKWFGAIVFCGAMFGRLAS